MIKPLTYLFDWDGTLGNSLPLWFATYLEVFTLFGVKTSYHEIADKVLGDWDGPANLGVKDLSGFYKVMEERLAEELDEVILNKGVMEMVQKIKAEGGKVGLVTTSKRSYVEGALKNTGLWPYLDVFLGKEDVSQYKPDPEILNKAMIVLGIKPEQTIMIGDSVKDIEAAQRAGVRSVLYFPKRYREFYGSERKLAFKPGRVIEDFEEMR